jgi:hypothetical protein
MNRIGFFALLLCFTTPNIAQPTTGELNGSVSWEDGAQAVGVTVSLTHLPTGTNYTTTCNRQGKFFFAGLHPGNGYKLEASHLQGKASFPELFHIGLGEVTRINIRLTEQIPTIKEVVVYTNRQKLQNDEGPMGRMITGEELNRYASGTRQLHELFRQLPEVKTDGNGDGSISVAGQNYRYNAIYTDGMISHDVFGISASGTYGGQAGISPVSMEAIEACKLVTTPMDAMQGHFTGAAIHTISKRGSNRSSSNGYTFFQNSEIAGQTLEEKKVGGSPKNLLVTTSGVSTQGAMVRNRLFYFFNVEQQIRQLPYFIHYGDYPGELIHKKWIPIIRNQLISEYGYDPGNIEEMQEKAEGQKILLRIDANLKSNHQLVFTGRYLSTRIEKPGSGGFDEIHFSNNGYRYQSDSYHLSLEWRKNSSHNRHGQWLLQLTGSTDVRRALGSPFPRVKIMDEAGAAWLGSDINSMLNQTRQRILVVRKHSQRMMGRHLLAAGFEGIYGTLHQVFVPAAWGYFVFSDPADFIKRRAPVFYRRNYYGDDPFATVIIPETTPVRILDGAVYANIRLKVSEKLTVWLGARWQQTWLTEAVPENKYVNDTIIPLFTNYRQQAILPTGESPRLQWTFHPKAALEWNWHKNNTWQVAIAWQSGRLPLVWPASLYANNGDRMRGLIKTGAGLSAYRLLPSWQVQPVGSQSDRGANQIPLFLISEKMSLPAQLRVHFRWILKEKRNTWLAECLVTRQINEPTFTQLNLLPSERFSAGPGPRKVYGLKNNASIPLSGGELHPFASSILLSNLYRSGAGSMLVKVGGNWWIGKNAQIEWSYANNATYSLQDATGSLFSSVWQQTETVQGKNDPGLSFSDFGIREKWVLGFTTAGMSMDKKSGWSISCIWVGQTGERYSYVYSGKSMIRDNGINGFNELMYIPTREEIQQMNWVPFHNGIRPISASEQAEGMEQWIQTQPYLMGRRGQFAERNGAELPFQWQCDLKLERRFSLLLMGQKIGLQFSIEFFNLAALIFPEAGRKFSLPDRQWVGIEFLGYRDEINLEPLFRFDPDRIFRSPLRENSQFRVGQLSRWLIQPGLKITI